MTNIESIFKMLTSSIKEDQILAIGLILLLSNDEHKLLNTLMYNTYYDHNFQYERSFKTNKTLWTNVHRYFGYVEFTLNCIDNESRDPIFNVVFK